MTEDSLIDNIVENVPLSERQLVLYLSYHVMGTFPNVHATISALIPGLKTRMMITGQDLRLSVTRINDQQATLEMMIPLVNMTVEYRKDKYRTYPMLNNRTWCEVQNVNPNISTTVVQFTPSNRNTTDVTLNLSTTLAPGFTIMLEKYNFFSFLNKETYLQNTSEHAATINGNAIRRYDSQPPTVHSALTELMNPFVSVPSHMNIEVPTGSKWILLVTSPFNAVSNWNLRLTVNPVFRGYFVSTISYYYVTTYDAPESFNQPLTTLQLKNYLYTNSTWSNTAFGRTPLLWQSD